MKTSTPLTDSNGLNYNPLGMMRVGRNWSVGSEYRYGFNTQEQDDEVYGNGNLNTAEFWGYDTRLGRRWNVDPKSTEFISVYAVFQNSPITTIDKFGDTTNYYKSNGDLLGTLWGNANISDVIINDKKYNKLMNANYTGWNSNPQKEKRDTQYPIYDNYLDDSQMEGLLNSDKRIYKIKMDDKVGMLARVGFAEFRNGNESEITAAYDITLNRINGKNYPNTLQGVIEQQSQYSFWYDDNLDYYKTPYKKITKNTIDYNAWTKVVSASIKIINGIGRGVTHGATLYYSPRSMNGAEPKWDFTKLAEESVEGVREDYMKIYRVIK